MKKFHIDIDFKEVLSRIEKDMEGYSPTAWAEKVGVKINVVSNIHSPKARQNPSLNYILAVSVATGKPIDYYLWGKLFGQQEPQDHKVQESISQYGSSSNRNEYLVSPNTDPEMGKRVRFWRQDMGLSIEEVAKRSDLPVDLINLIETGHHTTTDVIVKLAETLRCSIDFILGCGTATVPQPGSIYNPTKKTQKS